MLSVVILGALAFIGAAQENPIDIVDDVKPYEGSIGPASPLYGLKIAFENLVERFTFNEKEKIERQIEHAERRLSEAKSALKNNETEVAEKALGRYREKILVADDRISRINKTGPELLDAQTRLVKHELVLEQLLESNPDNRGLETALDNSHKFEDRLESKTGVKLGKDEAQREPEHGVEGAKITIGEGENVTVQCGSGSAGTQVRYVGGSNLGIAGYDIKKTVTTGGKVDLVAAVTNSTGAPAGAPLTWKLSTARGGRLSVNGCTATFAAASSTGTATVLLTIAAQPRATPAPGTGGEGGPVMAGGGKIAYINIAGGGGGSGGDRQCGKEWLQVSISGPYSYSQNTFWLSGPGTGNQWWGPFTNSRTFQPIAPGTYALRVTYAGGTQKTYNINVPACSYYKFVQSNQGWGR
ncbi:MAG: DUF5667 domain-containing protein [Candidatus Hydrothermarchaeota archaeon]